MQIDEALGKIVSRAKRIRSADDFILTPAGMEKLDAGVPVSVAMASPERFSLEG